MVEVRRVTLDQLRDQGADLFPEHWREVGYDTALQVNPLWPRFYAAEMGGGLITLGAYDGQQLVGYCAVHVGQDAFCQERIQATGQLIFVHREYRRSGFAARMVREAQRIGRELHGKDITWHAPQGSAFEALLCRMGYQVREVVYERAL